MVLQSTVGVAVVSEKQTPLSIIESGWVLSMLAATDILSEKPIADSVVTIGLVASAAP